ncbi:hypothetical protein [Gordonia araii]|nr:hypothetical protein [Gordonia araii]NNG96227.1 hypothetical protein [Gordonia araii NBRC 100433]
MARVTDSLLGAGAHLRGGGPDPRQANPNWTFQWTLDEAEIQVYGSATVIKIDAAEVTDIVAQWIYDLMVTDHLLFHEETILNMLAPNEESVPSDPMFSGSKAVHTWQELQQIANYDDPEQYFQSQQSH